MNGESPQLWKCEWIDSDDLKKAIDVKKIVIVDVDEADEVMQPEEIALLKQNAWAY
ncbi:MAG: hypothetical protein ACYC18_13400 [Gammaproteobacteria bacterium]